MATSNYLVIDIGGTTLRSALYDPVTRGIRLVRREAVHNFLSLRGATTAEVQTAVTEQLRGLIESRCADATQPPVTAACISFAGPIDGEGRVLNAPTIWGPGGDPLALGSTLRRALRVPVQLLNDVTAAAWRYADRYDEPFCLITVSSGVGNKVFNGRQVLVHSNGYGGEIGHLRVDFAPDALRCDCGAAGHLGGIASGRGTLAVARRFARAEPAAFATSLLATLCADDLEQLSTYHLVEAALADDAFARRCVRHGIGLLAQAVAGIYASIGVRRYLFMGGFAIALGKRYLEWLAQALAEQGLFGITGDEMPELLQLAEPDDDHGLIGAGRYLQHALAT